MVRVATKRPGQTSYQADCRTAALDKGRPPCRSSARIELTLTVIFMLRAVAKTCGTSYAGGYPGAIDAYQVNFTLPVATTPGRVPLHVSQAWIVGPDVMIDVRQ